MAENSDGSAHDAICEWAYNTRQYPALCAMVRDGQATIHSIARLVAGRRAVAAAA